MPGLFVNSVTSIFAIASRSIVIKSIGVSRGNILFPGFSKEYVSLSLRSFGGVICNAQLNRISIPIFLMKYLPFYILCISP